MPVLVAKNANVGVAPLAIGVVTGPEIGAGGLMQAPVAGLVSHRVMLTGKVALPVSALTAMVSPLPRFTVATANAPLLAKVTIPSPVGVAASATISGTGVFDADSNSVFRPVTLGAGDVLEQSNVNSISVGSNASVGVKENMNVCRLSGAMSTGVSGVPTSALVAGSVV